MVRRNNINTWITPTTANEITQPAQPAFLGYATANDANLTGDNTSVVLGDTDLMTTLTEVFDQNADFVPGSAAGAIFTAPVTGRHYLSVDIFTYGYDGTQSNLSLELVTSNGTYPISRCNPTNIRADGTNVVCLGDVFCDMDAADTAYVIITAGAGNKVVGIGTSSRKTTFSGYLVV